MKTSRILRSILLLAVVFGLVWCAVVLYWRATDANPSTTDVVLYLGVLPLGLVGSYWLLRKGIERSRRGPAAAAAEGQAATAAADGAPADFVLELIATAIQVPVGASGDAVAQALIEPARPELHPQLKDAAGLPVLAAQVDPLDTAALADALAAIVTDDDPALLFPEERLRALALIDPVADELLLAALEAMPPADDATPLHGRAAAAPPPILRVQLLLPASWPQAARQGAADWLQHKALATGFEATAISIESLPVASAADVWKSIATTGQAQQVVPATDRYLLLATDSHIGAASVERLGAQGRLLGARRQEGLIPGEAAAGVLLMTPAARPPSLAQPPPQLHRLASQRREGNGAHGKTTVRQLTGLIQQTLATSELSAEKIMAVVSDADHRPSRSMEIAGTVSALFPDLDPVQKCLNLGVACGHVGIAGPLALLAVAAAQSLADSTDVMVISLGDEAILSTLIVSPAAPDPPTPAAAQAAATAH